MKIDLGHQYRDTISGFTGIATGRTEYLHDTPSVQLTRGDSAGKPENVWVSEGRLVPDGPSQAGTGFGT